MFLTATSDPNFFQAFVNFVQDFGSFLDNITYFIVQFFTDLVYYIKLLNKAIQSIPQYFSWLPVPVVAVLGVTFALVVVFQVLGRT